MDNKPLVVNFIAGAGVGKSLVSYGVMYNLKLNYVNCEYLPEYAKTLSWRQDYRTLAIQNYITATQHRNLCDLCYVDNNLDVIVMDTSLLVGLAYQGIEQDDNFEKWVVNLYSQFNNLSYFLRRDIKQSYMVEGRNQTQEEAMEKDEEILSFLNKYSVEYKDLIMNGEDTVNKVVNDILSLVCGN